MTLLKFKCRLMQLTQLASEGLHGLLIVIGGDERTCFQKWITDHISCGHQSTELNPCPAKHSCPSRNVSHLLDRVLLIYSSQKKAVIWFGGHTVYKYLSTMSWPFKTPTNKPGYKTINTVSLDKPPSPRRTYCKWQHASGGLMSFCISITPHFIG